MESKYLKAFKHMQEKGKDLFTLYGDIVFLEEIPTQETVTKSGIVLASGGAKRHDGYEMNLPLFCRVLQKGDGFYDEDGKDVPPKCDVGDIVLIPQLSVMWFSVFGPIISQTGHRIGWTNEAQVKGRWFGPEAYEQAMKFLAEGLGENK